MMSSNRLLTARLKGLADERRRGTGTGRARRSLLGRFDLQISSSTRARLLSADSTACL